MAEDVLHKQNTNTSFIAGVVGVYVVGSLSQAAVERAPQAWIGTARERIWQREMRLHW